MDSLGISVKVRNELNNIEETSSLAENLKHMFYQAYKDVHMMTRIIIKIRQIFK